MWTGPFVVKTVHPYGVVEIENPENEKIIKVNGQRLKPFLENFDCQESIGELVDSSLPRCPIRVISVITHCI